MFKYFFELGYVMRRSLILKRMPKTAKGTINLSSFKVEYVFGCFWFFSVRLMSYMDNKNKLFWVFYYDFLYQYIECKHLLISQLDLQMKKHHVHGKISKNKMFIISNDNCRPGECLLTVRGSLFCHYLLPFILTSNRWMLSGLFRHHLTKNN